METNSVKKDLIHDLIQNIKEKKEARLALFYSVFYFIFITLLLLFGHRAPAQNPHSFKRVKHNEWKMPATSKAITNTLGVLKRM